MNRAKANELPVPKAIQHDVFQEFCSNQLFQLNNRDGKQKTSFSLKKVALEFADASHAEMLDSYRNEKDRLRQITSMNVTLDEGNAEQIQRLLELVDAGVFALHPRKLSTRTKNRGSDPVLQFQLSFRKILGISKLVGLSDRDRFELNGQQFLEWMDGIDGAINLVSAAPAFPAPKIPIAKPCLLRSNHFATYAIPTENEPPATPTNKPSTRKCQYSVANEIK